jgi:hypothetical protein
VFLPTRSLFIRRICFFDKNVNYDLASVSKDKHQVKAVVGEQVFLQSYEDDLRPAGLERDLSARRYWKTGRFFAMHVENGNRVRNRRRRS